MTTVSVVNHATVPLGVDLDALITALQVQMDRDFTPEWGPSLKLVKSAAPIAGTWQLVFLDDADQAGALGYHDLTASGLPLGKVFVKTTQRAGEEVSVTASHELMEMAGDPYCNSIYQGRKVMYAGEVADAVEEDVYEIDGVKVSNFVTRAWFNTVAKSGTFDYLRLLKKPFSLRPGGYISVYLPGRGWSEIFGSKPKGKRFAKEDRRGHRTELRRTVHARNALNAREISDRHDRPVRLSKVVEVAAAT